MKYSCYSESAHACSLVMGAGDERVNCEGISVYLKPVEASSITRLWNYVSKCFFQHILFIQYIYTYIGSCELQQSMLPATARDWVTTRFLLCLYCRQLICVCGWRIQKGKSTAINKSKIICMCLSHTSEPVQSFSLAPMNNPVGVSTHQSTCLHPAWCTHWPWLESSNFCYHQQASQLLQLLSWSLTVTLDIGWF